MALLSMSAVTELGLRKDCDVRIQVLHCAQGLDKPRLASQHHVVGGHGDVRGVGVVARVYVVVALSVLVGLLTFCRYGRSCWCGRLVSISVEVYHRYCWCWGLLG